MGKVVLHATMSLDGFIAGSNEEMDWVFKGKEKSKWQSMQWVNL